MSEYIDPLEPSPTLLIKLGSIIQHFDEYHEPGGVLIDLETAQLLRADPIVAAWFEAMEKLALVPLKRSKR